MAVQHIKLGHEKETRLKTWLGDSIQDILDRRLQRTYDWRRYRDQYEGKTTPKTFPWKNASNVHVPITAIITDAIHANLMNRIFGHERIWDVQAVRPAEQIGVNQSDNQPVTWSDAADMIEKYLDVQVSDTGMIDVYAPTEDNVLECLKLGTSVLFSPWVTLNQANYEMDFETGEIIKEDLVSMFDGIHPKSIPLEDFFITPQYQDIHGPDGAPLFGHAYYLRQGQFAARKKEGKYRALDGDRWGKILTMSGGPDEEELKDARTVAERDPDNFSDSRMHDHYLMDLWVKVQLSDKDPEVNLFITYHYRSGEVIAIRPWIYKTPPYVVFRYIKREGRFYAIGVPEMLESIQAGTNTSFNQAVDNATIANVRGFKVRAGTKTARMFGDFYPGKKFIVDRMDDIEDFQLGEVYPSIFQVGLLLRDFAERRSGVNDYNLGRESEVLGRGGTATSTMALLQESARRFDLYAKDIRKALGELGMQTIELLQQHKPRGSMFATMGEKGVIIEQILFSNANINLREHLRVVATAAGSSSNKEIARQNSITAFGILVQYMEKMFSLAQVMSNPGVPESIRKLAYQMSQTGERLMQRVLEGFELPDVAAFLPQLEEVFGSGAGQAQEAMRQQGVVGPPGQLPGGGEGGGPPQSSGPGQQGGAL